MPSLKSIAGWIFALVGSVLLNVSLFGLMPGLIQRGPVPEALEEIRQVRVVQIKSTPTPPKKELEKPRQVKREKTKIHPQSLKQRSEIKSSLKPALNPTLKPQLVFQLNPKLPKASMDLVMPGLEHFSMEGPIFKAHYTMGELDSPLTPLVKIPPIYPMLATRRGIEGYVTVEFLVTKKGRVQQIRIVDSRPEHVFDKSVTNCVSQWKFKPGTLEGIPVATLAQTTIRFKLENQ